MVLVCEDGLIAKYIIDNAVCACVSECTCMCVNGVHCEMQGRQKHESCAILLHPTNTVITLPYLLSTLFITNPVNVSSYV